MYIYILYILYAVCIYIYIHIFIQCIYIYCIYIYIPWSELTHGPFIVPRNGLSISRLVYWTVYTSNIATSGCTMASTGVPIPSQTPKIPLKWEEQVGRFWRIPGCYRYQNRSFPHLPRSFPHVYHRCFEPLYWDWWRWWISPRGIGPWPRPSFWCPSSIVARKRHKAWHKEKNIAWYIDWNISIYLYSYIVLVLYIYIQLCIHIIMYRYIYLYIYTHKHGYIYAFGVYLVDWNIYIYIYYVCLIYMNSSFTHVSEM